MTLRRSASIARISLFGLSTFAFTIGCGVGTPPAAPAAQPSAVKNGPQLGYIWSATERSLRPILGVPGSSLIGQSIVPAGTYISGAAAGITGLLQESDGALVSLHLPSATPIPAAGGIAPNSTLRLSPSGTAGIAYANSANIALITGLPDAPKTQTLHAPANLLSAVVSDNATVLTASASGSSVLLSVAHATQPTSVTTVSQLGGINFIPGSDDALITDAAHNTLTLLRNLNSAPAPQSIAVTGFNHPTAVAASRDGHYAIIANRGNKYLIRIDLTGATAPTITACNCQPTLLQNLEGNATFRITEITTGPTWLLTAEDTPHTLFIPAFKATAKAGGAR